MTTTEKKNEEKNRKKQKKVAMIIQILSCGKYLFYGHPKPIDNSLRGSSSFSVV